jgi:hypothetical protein
MVRDASSFQGGKKEALYSVTVNPKEGGKPLMAKKVVLADTEKEAKEKAGVADLLAKKGLKAKQVEVIVRKVTDIK